MRAITAETTFFGRTFDEAMALLMEARNYVVADELRHLGPTQPTQRLILCCEAMRVTARLTHVMAWLLAQKAVHAGEITLAQAAAEPFALGGRMICLDQHPGVAAIGDAWLDGLLDRSKHLYIRVSRLDEMVRREVDQARGGAGVNPS
jgi:regulator of CtrA degradation